MKDMAGMKVLGKDVFSDDSHAMSAAAVVVVDVSRIQRFGVYR
jgi:hypothetical protein